MSKTNINKDRSMIDHPNHYTFGGIEVIDFLEAKLPMITDPIDAYHWATVIKYLTRYMAKDHPWEDLNKALFHLNRLIAHVENS